MLLTLLLILIPMVWLVVTASAVAACRSASRADRLAAQQRMASERLASQRKDHRVGGSPATSESVRGDRQGRLVKLGA